MVAVVSGVAVLAALFALARPLGWQPRRSRRWRRRL